MKYIEKKTGRVFFIPLFLPNDIKNNTKNYSKYCFLFTETYAFGRLIEEDKSSGDLIEIFNFVGEIPSTSDEIIKSGLMFNPIHVSLGFSKKRWRFIFDSNNYNRETDSNYQNISFLLGTYEQPELWVGGNIVSIDKRTENIDRWIVYPPTKVENMIREKVKCLTLT